jgi:hypothetical protein
MSFSIICRAATLATAATYSRFFKHYNSCSWFSNKKETDSARKNERPHALSHDSRAGRKRL